MTSTKAPNGLDWLPNWEDESAYPDPAENVSKEQWAWEFIRRNPKYQRLYKQGLRHKETWYKKYPTSKYFYKYFKCTPKVTKYESFEEYSARCLLESQEPIIKPRARKILNEFPVLVFSSKLNPTKNTPPEFSTNYDYPRKFITEDFDKYFAYTIQGEDEVFIVFSPLLPITDQIDKAKEFLVAKQKEFEMNGANLSHKGRVQVSVLRNYLRYLDANVNGVKQIDMAKVIYPGQDIVSASQRVSTGLLKAKYYRDDGFFKILKTQILE